jgi:signal transduction histidine kinase
MKTLLVKFDIFNELDIVLAHKRASQICDLTGINMFGKTGFITAISEISRNCIEYANSGKIAFNIYTDTLRIEAVISDSGPGIQNLESILNKPLLPGSKGCGLQYSKKLVDYFNVESFESGTSITLGMKITSKSIPISKAIAKGWARFFEDEKPVSPYEEIKRQNNQLLEVTEQLKLKNLEVAEQLEEIKSLNTQLNRHNQELEDFAYTLSHDLRNPITNLNLLISIIEKSDSPEKKEEYLREFKKLINRIDYMISGLAEIIDLKNNQSSMAKAIAFEDIVKVVFEQLKTDIEECHADVICNFKIRPSIVYYEVYLHSIVYNLISNSIKYRSLKKPPKIILTTSVDGDFLLLKVEDNGIGMDLKKVGKRLFKPFNRFSTRVDGKGIGLHLVKSMIEKNGGKIVVESSPESGTTFYVYFKEYVSDSLSNYAAPRLF